MAFLNWFATDFWGDVVWSLIHSTWQAALIGLILAVVLSQIAARRAGLRYALCCVALVGIVLSTFFTANFRREMRERSQATVAQPSINHREPAATIPGANSVSSGGHEAFDAGQAMDGEHAQGVPSQSTAWIPCLAFAWLLGSTMMIGRAGGAVFRAKGQLKQVADLSDPQQLAMVKKLAKQFNLAVPKVMATSANITPYALGVLAPTIVVPMSMLGSLSAAELRSVLAHEMAHIRRHDYLANLFQLVVEAIYFFNPAVWWVSQQIRAEREACCDQVAANVAESEVVYASTLANWAEKLAGGSRKGVAMAPVAALGFAKQDGGGLLDRIRRIVSPEYRPSFSISPVTFGLVLLACAAATYFINSGTRAVASIAGEILSDEERVAVIEEEQQKLDMPKTDFEEGMAKISGKILVPEGGEQPIDGRVDFRVENTNTSYSRSGPRATESYSSEVNAGQAFAIFTSKNYAPGIAGPLAIEKDTEVKLDITLTRGEELDVKVVDESEQPLPGARISVSPVVQGGAAGVIEKWITNDRGEFTVAHILPNREHRLYVSCPGYDTHRKYKVVPQGEIQVRLKQSPQTLVMAKSAKGEPLAGVAVKILHERVGGMSNAVGGEPIAMTDDEGVFSTRLLQGISRYSLVAEHPELGRVIKANVPAGEPVGFVFEEVSRNLKLTVEGDVSKFRKRKGKIEARIWQWPKAKSYAGSFRMPLNVESQGDTLVLSAKGLLPGDFKITSGTFVHTGESELGLQEISVDASVATEDKYDPKKIDLTVRFEQDGKPVKPGGSLFYYSTPWEIEDGVARGKVAPDLFTFRPAGLVGFTFEDYRWDFATSKRELVIPVQPAGAVIGSVVYADGKPVSAKIQCSYGHQRGETVHHTLLRQKITSDKTGKYVATPLPIPSKAVVTAFDGFNMAVSQESYLDETSAKLRVPLQFPLTGSATVKVVDEAGNPVPNQPYHLSVRGPSFGWHTPGHGWGSDQFRTDDNGQFTVEGLGYDWDYSVEIRPEETYQNAAAPLEIGETIEIQLKRGNVVSGVLLDENDKPVPEATVQSYNTNRFETHVATTNEKGEFEFTQLSDGPTRIYCAYPETALVDVDPTTEKTVTLKVSKD